MNTRTRLAVLTATAAALVAASAALASPELERQAREQTERLNRWATERGEALPPGPTMERPAPLPPELVRRIRGDWLCASVPMDTAIHARPDGTSPVALTGDQVAVDVSRGSLNGFATIVHNGARGYVEAARLREYRNALNPRLKCSVAGIRSDGTVTFRIVE